MLRLVTDEDVHGDIVDGLLRRQPTVDLVRIQDVGLAHTADSLILEWAAQHRRVVVSVAGEPDDLQNQVVYLPI